MRPHDLISVVVSENLNASTDGSFKNSRTSNASSQVSEVVSQLTSAVTLSVSANNGTNNASNISAIVQQLTGVRDQVLSLANTTYQGRYLFGGSQGTTAPFTLDTSTSPATVTYNGDTNLQYIQPPPTARACKLTSPAPPSSERPSPPSISSSPTSPAALPLHPP